MSGVVVRAVEEVLPDEQGGVKDGGAAALEGTVLPPPRPLPRLYWVLELLASC